MTTKCDSLRSNKEMRRKQFLRNKRRQDALLKLPENVEIKKKKRLEMMNFGDKEQMLRPQLPDCAMKN